MKSRRFRRRTYKKQVGIRIFCVFLCLTLLLYYYLQKLRPLVIRVAVSYAESLFLTSADRAVAKILADENVKYNDMIRLSRDPDGTVTSLETDIVKINLLKSMISQTLSGMIAEREHYEISIPLGTFFSKTLTQGIGPDIHFRMQLTATAHVNFSHEFKAAGINQVLHLVMADIQVNGGLVMMGCSRGIHASTSVFAAQTLIVGHVPEAFTEVRQSGENDLAGTINDYGANGNKE